jgi:guanylate kinase
MQRPLLIVISAPSGCGKTTIAHEILRRNSGMRFSVSATTRGLRPGEVDGTDYFFLSREEFAKRIGQGDLVEWEEIYGDYYGTLKDQVESALRAGISVVFDIDVNGALSIKKKYPLDAVLIFIDPPSMDALKQRLLGRKTENPEAINKRIARMPMELERGSLFDFRVVNDDLERAVQEVDGIIRRMASSPRTN